jgi:prevent-host-death family protein
LEPAVLTVGSNPFRDRLGYWMDIVAAGQEVIVTRHGKPRLRLSSAIRRSVGVVSGQEPGVTGGHSPLVRG